MAAELIRIFLDVITPVYGIVLIGYLAGPRLGLTPRTLSRLAYYVLIPCFVFDVVVAAEINANLVLRMVGFAVVVHLLIAVGGYGAARLLGHGAKMTGAFIVVAVFGNVGNFGLPLIAFRLGDAALEAATVYFLAIMATAFVVSVAAANWTTGGSVKAAVAVLKTPALLALVPALPLNLLAATPPLAVSRITGLLGGAMVPIMLVTLGVQLAETRGVRLDRDVLTVSALRLLGSPLLAIALAGFFALPALERGAGILQSGMPAAVLCAIIALEYDLEPDFVTTAVLVSTLLSTITLTILQLTVGG